MLKKYVSEQELELIFESKFSRETWEFFDEWLDRMIDEGKIESIEFDHYDISKLEVG